jgi:hypothetical protein
MTLKSYKIHNLTNLRILRTPKTFVTLMQTFTTSRKILHIVKEECRHILKPNNEASLKSVQSSIQPDDQFIHPVIRLFTATLNPSRHSDGPSFFWVGLFLWQQQR